ncbi:hypothetical protein [Streptoalloteichus hindustanus]|uniref:Lipoprotein n=1 Tax=Streptoalloteichus hindustanus TaxID=2017 RepID=A0A1M5GDG0_STRHI|nr:hypothetical protein [Streptoalloteichus hindustanus]SHG01531.1 hypothetical protein SAMN05444320_10665 [Streptoalloteichus hindustanus]
MRGVRGGVVAAVVVAAGLGVAVAMTGCTPAPALRVEGSAPSSSAARPSAVSLDPTDIRTVDLRSVILADPGVGPLVKQAVLTCHTCGQENPTYVDLTGDHVEDVVVVIRQPERKDVAALFVYSFQRGEIRQIFSFYGNEDISARESGGDLVVRHRSGAEVVRARWDGVLLSVVESSDGRLRPTGPASTAPGPVGPGPTAPGPVGPGPSASAPPSSSAKGPTVKGPSR